MAGLEVLSHSDVLPRPGMAQAITGADITFGRWDPETLTFVEDSGSKDAVRVYAGMTRERGNPTPNILLRIIGFDTFNVAADSIFTRYRPPCFREGFIADDVVNVQSNNFYGTGFCLHSNKYVSINNNNVFEAGSVVSMPDTNDLDMPQGGWESNIGLRAALREGRYRLRALRQLPDLIDGLANNDARYRPKYVTDAQIYYINKRRMTPDDFTPGATHIHTCNGGKITLGEGNYTNVVFITDCEMKLENGAVMDESIFATRDTGARSVNSPQGFQIGRNDNCAEGGGSSVLTLGGVSVAAGLQSYNGQILAHGDIDFAAQAGGVQGTSFMTYGRIDSTSNMAMGFCNGRGQEELFAANYFRMAD
jgi:hypothetical protein